MNPGRSYVLFLITATAFCLVGCGPEREIEAKAKQICAYGQLDKPELTFIPASFDAKEHISREDLAFLEKKEAEEQKNPFAGLGNAFAAGLSPGIKAMVEANARLTTCTVDEIVVDEKGLTARVKVTRTSPQPADDKKPFEGMAELAEIEGHEARVEKALEAYQGEGVETKSTSAEVTFVKEDGHWFISYGLEEIAAKALREEQAKEERERKAREEEEKAREKARQARKLVEEARESMKWSNYKQARELLDQASALGAKEVIGLAETDAELKKIMAQMVAGRWRVVEEVDEMTDDKNVFVTLYSTEPVQMRYGKKLPTLHARCQENKFAMYVVVGSMVDSDWRSGTAKVRYRFGAEDAQTARLPRSDSREALFFRKEKTWLGRLRERDGQTLKMEVPLYSSGDVLLTFDLTGSEQALPMVMKACGLD